MRSDSLSIALDRFTTFGDLLKYLRRRTGMTQRELSIAVNYSDTQISRLEQNERMPDLATLTARFIPALQLEDQPEMAQRLLELAATMRREDAPAVGLPPYKGLQYFDEKDAELFFGREALTSQLLNRLSAQLATDPRFLAIIGASGSGKSSVVRAGLVPALRWQQVSSNWPVLIMTPTAHPLDALAGVLVRETQRAMPIRRLVDELASDPTALSEFLDRLAKEVGATHSVLVIDQFEELFTLCRTPLEKTIFVDGLMDAATQANHVAMIVLVMRADFYSHCAPFGPLREAISQYQEYIGPMARDELRRSIEEPARRGHWEFEPGLVDLLLRDVGAEPGHTPEPGALPLLSHALLATWQRRRGRLMTFSGYTASGGVRGAIAETADAVFHDQLETKQREIARQIFLRLTELGGDACTADTRRRVSFEELVSKPENREMVQEVLLALADARLISTDQDTAEVAHEALIREWPTLRGWLEEDRDGLRLHRRLTEAAQEWDISRREESVLFRGARLAQTKEWVEAHNQDVNALEKDFLDASQALVEKETVEREIQRQNELIAARKLADTERARAEEQTKSSKRLRARAIFLTVALVAVGILAAVTYLFWQRSVAANQLAISRELSAAAINQLEIDPERSALLALQALKQANTLEARNALHRAIPELHLLMNIPAHGGGVPDLAWSPDGTLVASIGMNGDVKLWDPTSGEHYRTLYNPSGELGSSVSFSPDGSILAAGYVTKVALWNVKSGMLITKLYGLSVGTSTGYNLAVGQVSFSPDGKRLAVANMAGISKVWDVAAKSQLLSLVETGMKPSKAIAYSPDGSLLATAGDDGLVKVWVAKDGTKLLELKLGGVIHSLSFDRTGSLLAAASEDGNVKVWDAMTGNPNVSLPRLSGLYDVAFLADGRFATAGQDGTVRLWDPETGQQSLLLAGPTSTVTSVVGSPDGKRIASGGYDGSLRIWDTAPGKELLTIPGHQGMVWNVAYSSDGKRIASASADGFVKQWDAESGALMGTLPEDSSWNLGFTGLAYNPDGTKLAGGSVDGQITIWDSQTGATLASLEGHTNMVVGLVFSPDGERLASASWDGTAKVWDLERQQLLTTFSGHGPKALVTGIAFNPDGMTVYSGADDKMVYQWDAATGQDISAFLGQGKEIYGVALSPDGKLLAAGNQDGNIYLWDVESRELRKTLAGHAGLVLRLAFNPFGTQLASAGFDRLVKVWDIESQSEQSSLFGNSSNVTGVSFSPDGTRLASAGADGSIRTYTLNLDELIEIANHRLSRTLTSEECQLFLHSQTCP